jgi:hypothetical protein
MPTTPSAERESSGSSHGWWSALFALLIAPLVWLGGAHGQVAAADSAETSAQSNGPDTKAPETASNPELRCSASFLAALDASGEPTQARDSSGTWAERITAAAAHVSQGLGASGKLDALVATIPDPIDSGSGYAFDSGLQAIRLGIESQFGESEPSLFRDRSFLPWLERKGIDDRESLAQCRNGIPGIITFRSGDVAAPRLMVVLLVGETPTSGVHHRALVNALTAAESLTRPKANEARTPLRILGPSFSGSAYSLRRAVKEWRDAAPQTGIDEVRIITGSATGGALRKTLSSEPGQPGAWFANGAVHFSATTIPEAQLQCRYLWFLRSGMGEGKSAPRDESVGLLDNVALLHESGTEFGSTLTKHARSSLDPTPCQLRAGIDLSFPANIAALRDAYEDMERKQSAPRAEILARPTNLEVSLRENRAPNSVDAEPSPKTNYARDVSVSRILGAISRTTIRHVVIQATDVADAIFLARKIRDVAPDVRLAFLRADVLLLHPAFQRDLFGSLVITPYPFLGSSDFAASSSIAGISSSTVRHREGFENDWSEGAFNAVLALRGATPDILREYVPLVGDSAHPEIKPILPVWIAAIGQDAFIPLFAAPSRSNADPVQSDVLYGLAPPVTKAATVGAEPPATKVQPPWKQNWSPFNHVELRIADNVVLPRLWRFLLVALGIGFAIDRFMLRRTAHSLSNSGVTGAVLSNPDADGDADRSIVRTKWKLYAAIRTFVVGAAFTYMAAFWVLAAFVHHDPVQKAVCVGLLAAVGCVIFTCGRAALDFAADYFRFARSAECITPWLFLTRIWRHESDGAKRTSTPPQAWTRVGAPAPGRWDRWTLWAGLARADVDISPAKLSFAQLRLLANLALVIATAFVAFQALALYWSMELPTGDNSQLLRSLLISRTLHLLGGLSPAAPTLLCLAVVYVWSVGRMARLRVVHSLSQLSPADEVLDLVSTPIRLALYPDFPGDPQAVPRQSDDSFTHVERRAINSIVRPITGPEYCVALGVALLLPIAIFSLHPLSTLETSSGTWLLYMGLFLCSSLIGNTIVQLFQYWNALQFLLKSVFQHRLGRSFSLVAPFVREPLHDQVSRTPHDVLRLAACASQFDDLVRTARHLDRFKLVGSDSEAKRDEQREVLNHARRRAVATSNLRNIGEATRAEEELGRQLIAATRRVTRVLQWAWDGMSLDDAEPSVSEPMQTSRYSSGPAPRGQSARTEARVPSLPKLPVDLTRTIPSAHVGIAVAVAVAHDRLDEPGQIRPEVNARVLESEPVESLVPEAPRHSIVGSDSPSAALAPEAWRYEKNERRWVKNAEAFAATVVALLINRHVRQLDYFVYTLLTSALLLMLGALSYPFEPHRLLLTWIWGLILAAAAAGIWIYIELDRNSLLSRIARTNPGELTLNRQFVLRVVTWGIVPLTAAAATQYPALANTLARIIAPFTATH